jgi:hypothetical protein
VLKLFGALGILAVILFIVLCFYYRPTFEWNF